jgi:MFS family permease
MRYHHRGNDAPARRRRPAQKRQRTFESLSVRNYRLYFIGQSISVAGTWMQNVALAWLVLELSHSGTVLGIFTGLRFLPLLVLGPWGGVVIDRHDKWRLICVTQLILGALSALLAVLTAVHVDSILIVMLIGASLGIVNVVDNPARQSFMNEMVPPEMLGNAITLNSVTANAARIIGPAVAGILIAALSVSAAFALNAVSFGAVIASMLMMNRADLDPPVRSQRASGQLRSGFRYVRGRRKILLPLIMIAVVGAFTWEFQVTLPLLAADTFHGQAWTYSAMLSSTGAGAIIGGLVVARRVHIGPRALAWSSIGWGLAVLAASAAPNLITELVLLVPVGYGTIAFNSLAKTSLQLATAPAMLGRVMALWAVAWQGTTPLGGPVVGWIGQELGARWSLVAGGVPATLVGLIALRYSLGSGPPASPPDESSPDDDARLQGLAELRGSLDPE